MAVVAGIDVAGAKRGFHAVLFETGSARFYEARHWSSVEEVVENLAAVAGLRVVAIDCPPRAYRSGPTVRQAERELHQNGIRPQWTRAPGEEAQAWMLNGEALWRRLAERLPGVTLIESFPTAVAKLNPIGAAPSMPLDLIKGDLFKHRVDVLDACLCAWTAARYLTGDAKVAGRDCPDGPIYY